MDRKHIQMPRSSSLEFPERGGLGALPAHPLPPHLLPIQKSLTGGQGSWAYLLGGVEAPI